MKIEITLELEIVDNELKSVKVKNQNKKEKGKEEDLAGDIVIRKGSLKFSKKLIDAINAKPGDIMDIAYELIDGNPVPVIATADTWNSPNGNKLTGQLSMAYKGDALNVLKSQGEVFIINKVVGNKAYFEPVRKSEMPKVENKVAFSI